MELNNIFLFTSTVTDFVDPGTIPGGNPGLPPAPPIEIMPPEYIETTASDVDLLLLAVEGVVDFSVGILNYIIQNPILAFGLGASLIPVGLKVLKIMKKSVKWL